MKSAQAEVVTLVLVSGIVIALVGTAYFWGKPLIEKRTAANDFSLYQRFADDLDAAVTTIANSKSGSEKLRLPGGSLRVIPYNAADPDNNSIIVEFPLSQKLIVGDDDIFYKTSSTGPIGTFGSDEPRIITFRQRPQGTGYTVQLRLRYRELDLNTPPKKAFMIALNEGGQPLAGTTEVSISYTGFVSSSTAFNGGPLILTKISVSPV